MLQAYTSEFRQKSTTFVMACSIVGMMEAVARLTPLKRTEWQRTWWVRAAAAAATPQRHTQLARHSRRGAAGTTEPVRHSRHSAAGAAQPARHSWRGTSPRSIVALSEKHIKSSANQILCLPDSVLCTARWDGNRSVEGDEECSCIRPDCVVESSTVSFWRLLDVEQFTHVGLGSGASADNASLDSQTSSASVLARVGSLLALRDAQVNLTAWTF